MVDRGFGDYAAVGRAIQTQEGYYPGSRAYNNNNPGNLIASSWTQQQPGYVGVDSGGFAIFASYTDGWNALLALIGNYAASGATVQSMMAQYAPASQAGNNPGLYAQNVAAAAGISPSDPLTMADISSPLAAAGPFDLSSLFGSSGGGLDLTGLSGGTLALAGLGILALLWLVER